MLLQLWAFVPLLAPQEPPLPPAAEPQASQPAEAAPQTTLVRAPRSQRTASATAAGSIVLDAQDLARTGERSLPRAISKAAGVVVQETNLGGGSPILRGLIGNQVLIMIDGVRLNDSTTREGPNQSLNSIDPATVERVEILKGPSSVLYGSDGLGGTILITTRSRLPANRAGGPVDRRSGVQGALDGFYNSSVEGYQASVELSAAGENDGVLGIASHHDFNDLVSGGNETVENTGFDGGALFGSWVHAMGPDRSLRLALSRTRDEDVPRTDRLNLGFGQSVPANEQWSYALQDRARAVLAYDDREAGGIADAMQLRFSLRSYSEERITQSTGSTTERMESDVTDSVGVGADWRRAVGGSQLLTWGLDVDFDDVDSTRADTNLGTGTVTPGSGAFAPGSNYLSTGIFLQDELVAWDPFFLTVGARYSYYAYGFDDTASSSTVSGDFDALTGSLQLARDLSVATRIGATLSQGFRAPNLADLAKNASFAGGTELANPDLDPEQSWMAELALDHVQPVWSAGLAVYYNEINDAIGRRLVDPGGPSTGDEIYQRDNVGQVTFWGAELEGSHRLGGAQAPFALRASLEAIWGRQYDDVIDPSTGEQPFWDVPARRVPPVHGLVALRYDPPALDRQGLWSELGFNWALEQDQLNPGDLSDPRIDPSGTEGWTTLDFDIGGPLGSPGPGSTWRMGVHNIFDETYRVHGSGFDAPGLSFIVGLRLAI